MTFDTATSVREPAQAAGGERKPPSGSELGRWAIIAGWLITMTGVAGYVVAMSRAGPNADILDGLFGQGALGWLSGVLTLAGIAVWFTGNCACLKDWAQTPRDTGE